MVDDLGALRTRRRIIWTKSLWDLRPVPVRAQRPAVDDVADEIDGAGLVGAEEIEKSVGLRTSGAEVDVGVEQGGESDVPDCCRAIAWLSMPSAYQTPMTAR